MKHAIGIFLMTAFLGLLMTSCDDGIFVEHQPELAKYPVPTDTIPDRWKTESETLYSTSATNANGYPLGQRNAEVTWGTNDEK